MSFVKRKLAALVHRRVSGWNLLAIRCLAIGDTHVNETLRRDLKLNYDLQHLQSLTQEQLIYKLVKLQRTVDSYHQMFSAQHFDGRDKVRVPYPDPENFRTDRGSLRRIALKVVYIGWQYMGCAYEGRSSKITNVVERVLLEAMMRQQLISSLGPKIHLDRSGRTDRQVSSLAQTIAVNVRSALKEGYGVWRFVEGDDDPGLARGFVRDGNLVFFEDGFSPSDTTNDAAELPYLQLLNKALPYDVRVLAWAPVRRTFSPRYQCKTRVYRYTFARGNLDIDLMNEAAQQLVGTHDFRNFCKITEDNAFKHFVRTIYRFNIETCKPSRYTSATNMCAATIAGNSFLQRQVRMMMSLLTMVGSRLIPPSTIAELLDIEKTPRKPSYTTCSAVNLTLVDTQYEDNEPHWRWDQDAMAHTAATLARMYGDFAAKTEIVEYMFSQILDKLSDQSFRGRVLAAMADSCKPEPVSHRLEWDGPRKTVDEKRQTFQDRSIRSQMRRGQYARAARLVRHYREEGVSDPGSSGSRRVEQGEQGRERRAAPETDVQNVGKG